MADLTIPKGQTYPFIEGYVADDDGAMDDVLEAAHELVLVLDDGAGSTPLELAVSYVEPGRSFDLAGQEIPVNWECDYSASALASTLKSWRAKLKITHDSDGDHVQYCPKDGFIEITITANVTEA